MRDQLDEYRAQAHQTTMTSYASKASMRKHNTAADRMREIVADAVQRGSTSVLIPLLDEPECARWLAFQLLELAAVDATVETHCVAVIEGLAQGSGHEALGSHRWLEEWHDAHGR